MIDLRLPSEGINFGEVSEAVDAILQEAVVVYRRDKKQADSLFRKALASAPSELPIYFCLYKIHTYQGNLEEGEAAAHSGLEEAARQAGWDTDWRKWTPQEMLPDGAGRFALYTLKALAFIHLRQNRPDEAAEKLAALRELDPTGAVGWPVVAALAEGLD
ncbi:tetratricopeptide repeat protein [Xanthobacter sp. AM11]|uniref:tetratricopeptide repeat protein n=1 Tax=Xanthobacter sp. AM11 TaxID=3380643 RepID=UPI0039BF1119